MPKIHTYFSTFCHSGRTLRNHKPATRILGSLAASRMREQKSVCAFSPNEIHLVLILIDLLSKYKRIPCEHRSNG